jgi:hypothetical protein
MRPAPIVAALGLALTLAFVPSATGKFRIALRAAVAHPSVGQPVRVSVRADARLDATSALRLVAVAPRAEARATQGTDASARVLGVDRNGPRSTLAWFDAQTMRMLPGKQAPLAWHVGSWSLAADRSVLAIGGEGTILRFVDARRMRVLGDVRLAPGGSSTGGVTWLRPDRLLAFVRRTGDTTLAVVDPTRRRVLRRVGLDGQVDGIGRLPDALVLLLRPGDGLGPARVSVVDTNGGVRTARLDRIPIGSPLQLDSGEIAHTRAAGFAVDPGGRAAYVVDASTIAQVDLDTLTVAYRSSPRQLAKAVEGPYRSARWLGGGLVAVSGADYATTRSADGSLSTAVTPYGLRLLDVRGWTVRVLDPEASGFDAGSGILVVRTQNEAVVYGVGGGVRFRADLSVGEWVNVSGPYAEVCSSRSLVAVLDTGTGTRSEAQPGGICADLLTGRSSDY